jgi:hypothetical protein
VVVGRKGVRGHQVGEVSGLHEAGECLVLGGPDNLNCEVSVKGEEAVTARLGLGPNKGSVVLVSPKTWTQGCTRAMTCRVLGCYSTPTKLQGPY